MVEPFSRVQVGENEWSFTAHETTVPIHHGEVGADVRSQIDFIDDEQSGPCDGRTAFFEEFYLPQPRQ